MMAILQINDITELKKCKEKTTYYLTKHVIFI